MLAPGATAPATSISSATSPSALFGSPVGAFAAPSTDTALTGGAVIPRFPKKAFRSLGLKPPPSSRMPIHWPAPCTVELGGGFNPNDLNRSEGHTSELQSSDHLVCRLLLD